jgi:quercetin dioxygenase-like cupin family protein
MTRRMLVLAFTFTAGAVVGNLAIPSLAQGHKTVFMTRLFTGPDNQTHAEEVEMKWTPGNPTELFKLLQVTSAELHRTPGGNVDDWHRAPRRQYVITLSGHAELEVAGGKKITVGPGNVDLVEDTTGKGHVTKVVGTDDRITLQLPLADQAGK